MTPLPGVQSIACTVLLSLTAVPALAQNRLSDISVGASVLTEIHTGGTLPGITGLFTTTDNRGFGVTGEVTGSQFVLWLLAGPRFTSSLNSRRTVYAQVLGGLAMAGGEPYFAVQPGAGVDFWLKRGLGVRAGADYQQLVTDDEPWHVFRMHAGVVVKVGRR
jgi:hypothetical protein